jgi:hypothetical protein
MLSIKTFKAGSSPLYKEQFQRDRPSPRLMKAIWLKP